MAASDKVATGGSPAFPAPHNRALMHLLLSSGMRKAHVTTLNRTDVDEGWADSAVIVGKGSKERRVSAECSRRSIHCRGPWRPGTDVSAARVCAAGVAVRLKSPVRAIPNSRL